MTYKLEISHREKYSYSIIDINGNIEYDAVIRIENYIKNHSSKDLNIILNFKNVSYIGRSSLIELVHMTKDITKKGKNIFLMNASMQIIEILVVNGLKNFFKIIKNEDSLMLKKKKKELEDILDISDDDLIE